MRENTSAPRLSVDPSVGSSVSVLFGLLVCWSVHQFVRMSITLVSQPILVQNKSKSLGNKYHCLKIFYIQQYLGRFVGPLVRQSVGKV